MDIKKIFSNKKNLMLVLVLIAILLAGIIFYFQGFHVKKSIENIPQKEATPASQSESEASLRPQTETAQPVPENIKVPEKGESVPEEVAAPNVVTEAAPGVSAKFRSFDIKAENNKFNPSTVIVRLGDTVHINFTAQDKDYDITFPDYGMKQTAKKGETKILEFQAVIPGKFTFYCELCGGLNSSAKGYIIVSEK
jgi:plastocyanin